MSHYDIFGNKSERLISKLYATYLQFYEVKQEFIKKREAFVKVLSEQKEGCLQPILDEEKAKEAKEKEEKEKEEKEAKEVKKVNEGDEGDEEEEEKEKEKEKEKEEEAPIKSSSLFHKLALATHPDKHPLCNPIYFQQAQKANEEGKFAKLIFLSRLLKIETSYEFSDEEVTLLQKAIEKKENKIQHYQKTYPWLYAQANSEELRKKLLEAFFKVNAS